MTSIVQVAAAAIAVQGGSYSLDDAELIARVAREAGVTPKVVRRELTRHAGELAEALALTGADRVSASSVAARSHTAPILAACDFGQKEAMAARIAALEVRPVDHDELAEGVLLRTEQTDRKSRAYGTRGNDGVPPPEVFCGRVASIPASELGALIAKRKHGIHPTQEAMVAELENDDLTEFREDEPISAVVKDDGLHLTGGHHRTNEILKRIADGRMSPETRVEVLLHA